MRKKERVGGRQGDDSSLYACRGWPHVFIVGALCSRHDCSFSLSPLRCVPAMVAMKPCPLRPMPLPRLLRVPVPAAQCDHQNGPMRRPNIAHELAFRHQPRAIPYKSVHNPYNSVHKMVPFHRGVCQFSMVGSGFSCCLFNTINNWITMH